MGKAGVCLSKTGVFGSISRCAYNAYSSVAWREGSWSRVLLGKGGGGDMRILELGAHGSPCGE